MSTRLATVMLLGLVLGPVALRAEEFAEEEAYGPGAHAFFPHDYQKANELFTAAIGRGTEDPRCYYFRGLTRLRLGDATGAGADFARGAELEAVSDKRHAAVSAALQRVQGEQRVLLEKYRLAPRAAALQRAAAERTSHRERQQRQEEEALRVLSQSVEPSSKTSAFPAETARETTQPAQAEPAETNPPETGKSGDTDPFDSSNAAAAKAKDDASGGDTTPRVGGATEIKVGSGGRGSSGGSAGRSKKTGTARGAADSTKAKSGTKKKATGSGKKRGAT